MSLLMETLGSSNLVTEPLNKARISRIALYLVGAGQYGPAALIFELLRSSEPDHGYYNRALGICYERIDRLEDAREALERAIITDPKDALALISLAAIDLRGGDKVRARQKLESAQVVNNNQDPKLTTRIALMLKGASVV